MIVAARNQYSDTGVWLTETGGPRIAIESVLDLQSMGLAAGTRVTLETDGPDESPCAAALAELLQKTYDFS